MADQETIGFTHDPDEYARCSAPHETEDAAKAALSEFQKIVWEARARLRLSNVVVAATVTAPSRESLLAIVARGDIGVARKLSAVLHGYYSNDDAEIATGRQMRAAAGGAP